MHDLKCSFHEPNLRKMSGSGHGILRVNQGDCVVCLTGAQSIAYFAGKSSAFTFAAAQADSVSTCLLQASTSVDPSVQVS